MHHGAVVVRLIERRDAKRLQALLDDDRDWLVPWEATIPGSRRRPEAKWLVKGLLHQYRQESTLPFVIEVDGQVVGQLNVANVLHGSVSSGTVGYWVSRSVAGRGVTPVAVALVCDFFFFQLGMHRIEIDIRPENRPSLRVVEKLGFRHEGVKERYIHINGAWRDHQIFALTREEVGDGLLARLKPLENTGIKHTEQSI